MATKTHPKAGTKSRARNARQETPTAPAKDLEQVCLPLQSIDISPFNYRKFYRQDALEEFAGQLKVHGIISPLTVRRMPSGRYELVAGERRLRAATLAGLTEVPVVVRELTDAEVREIQLAENIQRENPHPMHEAQAILAMQAEGKSLKDIMQRLGKSKAFVFGRLKLATLSEAFQEMFLADVITLQQALEIATLATESQAELFEVHCRNWKDQKGFRLHNLSHLLSQFRYNLADAPFDPKDKDLLPEAGACSRCPFNSATLKSLFPESSKDAVCTNRGCYNKKAETHLRGTLLQLMAEGSPDALVFYTDPAEQADWIKRMLPEAAHLPLYNYYEITVVKPPEMPEKEEYISEDEEDCAALLEAYEEAVEEYNAELAEFNALVENGQMETGLLIWGRQCSLVRFTPEQRTRFRETPVKQVTAKEVQEAIKQKTITPALIDAELERMRTREAWLQEIDQEKVLLAVHEQFSDHITDMANNRSTPDDLIATRLLIYQSLGYHERSEVEKMLFANEQVSILEDEPDFLQRLAGLDEAQHSYLVRKALAAKPESKCRTNITSQCLYNVARSAGVNTEAIEQQQAEKADARTEKMEARTAQLEKLKAKLLAAKSMAVTTENE